MLTLLNNVAFLFFLLLHGKTDVLFLSDIVSFPLMFKLFQFAFRHVVVVVVVDNFSAISYVY